MSKSFIGSVPIFSLVNFPAANAIVAEEDGVMVLRHFPEFGLPEEIVLRVVAQDHLQDVHLEQSKITYLEKGLFCSAFYGQCDQIVRLPFYIWPFTEMKICSNAEKLYQSGYKTLPNTK